MEEVEKAQQVLHQRRIIMISSSNGVHRFTQSNPGEVEILLLDAD